MEDRKFQSKNRYLVSFIIATVLFVGIITISYSLSYFEFARISNLQGDVAYNIFADKLDYTLFQKGVCFNETFNKVSQDLNFQGRTIDDLEKKFGKNDEGVLARKKFYTLVELEHLEFVNLLNDKCDLGMSTILFFYSNQNADVDKSEALGRLLDAVVDKYKNSLMIYSFDINLDSPLMDKLKIRYEIQEPLSIVINEGTVLINPQNIKEIEDELKISSRISEKNRSIIYLN